MPRRPIRPATALLAALALACVVVGGLWAWQSRFEAGVMDGSIPSDLAFDTLDALRRWLSAGVAACLLGLSVVLGWMARSVRRDGLWPPGGRSTRALPPRPRRLAFTGLAACAAASLLGAAVLALSAWR